MSQTFLREFFPWLMPQLVAAGKTALEIQKQLTTHDGPAQKDEGSAFARALTDADGIIQTQLGAALLGQFPHIRFIGEEEDRVSRYFLQNSRISVTLDPVNGTLFYKNGLPIFDIILTVRYDEEIIGAIVYLPAQRRFFYATSDGAVWSQGSNFNDTGVARLLNLCIERLEPIIVTSSLRPEIRTQLESAGFRVVDMAAEYKPGDRNWKFSGCSLLRSQATAIVKERGSLMDWGAVAYIASRAGGRATDFAGNPPAYDPKTLRAPTLVASSSPEVHERILNAIR